ncbi:MAG: S26 family signal peptidase [Candidatus Saccharimonadales bacterium]
MQSPKSSIKAKRLRHPILLRRVVGGSMSPKLSPGQLLVSSGWFRDINPGEVCIFYQDGREKVKRAERVTKNKVFFIGDNLSFSSDSRHFGWIKKEAVIAKVIWPKVHN